MVEDWETYQLKDLVTKLGDGLHGTPKYSIDGEYHFVNGNNLIDGKIVLKSNTKRVSFEEYFKYKKELNDRTLLVSINGTIGKVAYYNDEKIMLGKSACYFNVKKSVEKGFIKHVISSDYFINYLESNYTGSVIKNVSLKSMREFPVNLPPLPEQEAIASILSALDAKIELNLQMNKTLEDMAMALYKHWFVDFGPFQDEKFVESELGKIPKSWKVKSVDSIANFIDPHPSHRAPKVEKNGYPFAGIGDIDEMGNINLNKSRKIGEEAVNKQQESYTINETSVGFGRVGTVGKVVRLRPQSFRYSISPTLAVINSIEKEYSEFIFYMVKSKGFLNQVFNNQTGSTRPTIGITTLRALKIAIPNDIGIIRNFKNSVKNLYLQGDNLNKENQNLATLRDTLLPKLIRGEVRLKEFQKTMEQVL